MMFQTLSILGMALVIATYTGIALAEMQPQPVHSTSVYNNGNVPNVFYKSVAQLQSFLLKRLQPGVPGS